MALVVVLSAVDSMGAAPVEAAAQEASTASSPKVPAHPDADYLGSTVAAHRNAVAVVSPMVAPVGTPGLDVSHYQGSIDWAGVAAGGAKFAYMKASEGTSYLDPSFGGNYAGSANAGLVRGAYHFGLPSDSSGGEQAMFFLAHGGGWVSDGHTLPPVLDIEYNPYGSADWTGWCYGLSPAQLAAWIADFAGTVHGRTNRWPVIYTTNGWWSNCTGNDAGFGNDPLWIAPSNSDAGGAPTIPASWGAYTFFQYATSGAFPGDQDVFNGTLDQLTAFTAGDTPDKIVEHYTAMGGSSSYLGRPSGGEYPVAGGWAQDYEHGTIYYSPATGAWALRGSVLGHYRALGGPAGALGFPTSDETWTADGVGNYNDFAGSGGASIYWSQASGAWSLHGEIRAKYLALGGEQALGFPTTDENGTPDGVGRYNHFSGAGGASVYWAPGTGAHAVQGAIRSHWAQLGWETGPGYPVTDETGTPDGVGRYNHFTRDTSIYFTSGTGAHAVQGAIRDRWIALGWESGLGYPTTDESGTADGVGRYNHFSKSASVYWTPSTGAWAVGGAIRDRWASLGWETSRLGYPTSNEYSVPDGRRNDFQHGSITWSSVNGTTTVTYL